jgi:hypothetical protein
LFHLIFESHDGRAFVPIPKRSASPRATSKPQRWDSLKVLDPEWPIREADVAPFLSHVRFAPESGHGRFVTACPLSARSGHRPLPRHEIISMGIEIVLTVY